MTPCSDLEHARKNSTKTYEDRKGVFYAPLKNEWDKETAYLPRWPVVVQQRQKTYSLTTLHADMRGLCINTVRSRSGVWTRFSLFTVNQTQFVGKNVILSVCNAEYLQHV